MSWPHSLTLSLRTKRNKSDSKIKKCWDISRINSKRKSNKKRGKDKNKKSKRNKWEITWLVKFKKRRPKKQKKRKSILSKLTYGKRTPQTFSKTKRIRPNTLSKFTNNTNIFWWNKWNKKKTTRTERKWTLWSCCTIRPLWRQPDSKISKWKRQKFEDFFKL